MRRSLPVLVTFAILFSCGGAQAGQIWTDGDGDGLPDASGFTVPPGTNVTIGVWIDAQSFTWTNFVTYIEWSSDCISYVSAEFVIEGVVQAPIDNFTHPRGIGFRGSDGNGSGIAHIGNVTLRINTPVNCCVWPIIDVENPYYVYSQLVAGSTYRLFTTNPASCYGAQEATGACCFPDGSCAVMPPTECDAAGGTYQGNGFVCSGCIGACCLPDGQCTHRSLEYCKATGGEYQGYGSQCGSTLCGEACCFAAGSCRSYPAPYCTEIGGVPQGPGTRCEETNCPVVGGACCLGLGGCIETTTEEECWALGGYFVGMGVPCWPSPCINAVEPRSWGRIKGLFR